MSSELKNIVFDLGGVLFEATSDIPYNPHNRQTLFSPLKEGITLLNQCHESAQKYGHKLFVCSNWSLRYIEMLEQDFPDIFKVFDGIVTPTVAQAKKPDPKIFSYLLDTYNLNPSHSIFIDDQAANVEAARHLGMIGICLSNFNEIRNLLKMHGVLTHG